MDSDDYFEDELDSAFLQQVDAIEAAAVTQPAATVTRSWSPEPGPSEQRPKHEEVIELSSGDEFESLYLDDAALQEIDEACARELQGIGRPSAAPHRAEFSRAVSKNAVQVTLFGDIAPSDVNSGKQASTSAQRSFHRSHSGPKARKTKQWDHTLFAKTGWKQSKEAKAKAKFKFSFDEDDEHAKEEEVEFEQFPAPFVSVGPPPPMRVKPDILAARRWIYPLNQPKRDYQFNIVKHCLFENTLVALPTGLGKTFIAGVVMLNYYTWFPEGKVIFLAPTKPLVAQQIEACHKVCGIPGSHAAELTGGIAKPKRARLWEEKRVFYMTPQTLQSDFISNNFDPADIVLVVFDEAHRGNGDYSYAQIVRFMMAKNPHVRTLALTATPGSNPEAVQAIVDCLHISHIEIRDENSLDLRQYLNKKKIELHTIGMNDDVNKIKDLLSKVMHPLIKQVQSNGALRGNVQPATLHSFRCQQAPLELKAAKAPAWVYGAVRKLGPLSRAMGYLLEASTNMCYGVINELLSSTDDRSKPVKGLTNDKDFKALLQEIEMQKNRGFSTHPKMDKLRTLLVDHFASHKMDKQEAGNEHDPSKDPRVMVFVSFRECVDEVVELLNQNGPLIRATRFVGQSADKQGRKGFAQKEQLEVINKFKAGEYNCLISTSIGEEGLDIGEVDMIVCYDAQKTPIRMLQRIGRTGRKRDGVVHVLLAEGREEKNWDKAQEKYKDVQNFIVRAEQLELYDDVERLIPEHIHPECTEMMMEIEEHVREDSHSRKGSLGNSPPAKGTKRKRNDDPLRNVPDGASSGFVSVSQLLMKGGASKKKRRTAEFDMNAGSDDSDDLEIEAGLHGPRRAASTSVAATTTKVKKPRRSKTIATSEDAEKATKGKKGRKKAYRDGLPTPSQFERMGKDDSGDEDIEKGLEELLTKRSHYAKGKSTERSSSPGVPLACTRPNSAKASSSTRRDVDVIDLTTPDSRKAQFSRSSSPEVPLHCSPAILPRSSPSTEDRLVVTDGSSRPPATSSSPGSRSVSDDYKAECGDMSWLIEDDEESNMQIIPSSPVAQAPPPRISDDDGPVEASTPAKTQAGNQEESSRPLQPVNGFKSAKQLMHNMPPPALPTRLLVESPGASDDAPEPSFFIRPAGKASKKRPAAPIVDSSPSQPPPPSQRRLQRLLSSSPPALEPAHRQRRKKRKIKDYAEAQKLNPWIDVGADHSGEEDSEGSSGSEDELGSESDRRFVEELPETQVSPSYDQAAVYRRSLFTQASGTAPVFRSGPARKGLGAFVPLPDRRRHVASSSPRNADEDDDYMFGSFVVEDDAEISYTGSSEG